MGKARILGGGEEGLYEVAIEYDMARRDREMEWTEAAIEHEEAEQERIKDHLGADPDIAPDVDLDALLSLHNAARAALDLPPLSGDIRLHDAAQKHANWMMMSQQASHGGIGGSRPADRIADEGYPASLTAENVAAGPMTIDVVMQEWLDSPGHRGNVLDPMQTDVGLGFACAGAGAHQYFWCVKFGRLQEPPEGEEDDPQYQLWPTSAGMKTLCEYLPWLESKLRMQQLVERRAFLEDIQGEVSMFAWCADFTEDLSGDVGTIEVPGEPQAIIIRPGFADGDWSEGRDGQLNHRETCSPAQAFLNAALLPGWQKWRPTFRVGTITALDASTNTANVTLDAAESSANGLLVNQSSGLSDVPIDYMDCGADAFDVGDRVLIEFQNRDWDNPKLIGFESNPKECVLRPGLYIQSGTAYFWTTPEAKLRVYSALVLNNRFGAYTAPGDENRTVTWRPTNLSEPGGSWTIYRRNQAIAGHLNLAYAWIAGNHLYAIRRTSGSGSSLILYSRPLDPEQTQEWTQIAQISDIQDVAARGASVNQSGDRAIVAIRNSSLWTTYGFENISAGSASTIETGRSSTPQLSFQRSITVGPWTRTAHCTNGVQSSDPISHPIPIQVRHTGGGSITIPAGYMHGDQFDMTVSGSADWTMDFDHNTDLQASQSSGSIQFHYDIPAFGLEWSTLFSRSAGGDICSRFITFPDTFTSIKPHPCGIHYDPNNPRVVFVAARVVLGGDGAAIDERIAQGGPFYNWTPPPAASGSATSQALFEWMLFIDGDLADHSFSVQERDDEWSSFPNYSFGQGDRDVLPPGWDLPPCEDEGDNWTVSETNSVTREGVEDGGFLGYNLDFHPGVHGSRIRIRPSMSFIRDAGGMTAPVVWVELPDEDFPRALRGISDIDPETFFDAGWGIGATVL